MQRNSLGRGLSVFAAVALCAAGSAAGQMVFSNNTGITIPALGGASTPYPSEIMVAGLTDQVGLVRVKINGLTHDEINDVDILLVAPDGTKVLLMSDVGGLAAVAGIDLVFDDAYPPIPAGPLVSGTYAPTNLDDALGTDDFDAPAPLPPYESSLASLTGKAGNGAWHLYVMDDFGGDGGSITSWELEIFEGFYVTSTADAGPGSLREAIAGANLNANASTIFFLIPDIDPGYDAMSGVWTIAPASELPTIVAPLTIDGLSQPGAECTGTWPPTLKVVLSGAGAGPAAMGLPFASTADGSVVRGLVINHWSFGGIDFNGPSDCVVQSCFIGTDHTGTAAAGNDGAGIACRAGATGILIGSDGDGVDDACERNVVSGNEGVGIGAGNAVVSISGNFIGTDVTGLLAVPNLAGGVRVQNSSDVTIGRLGLLQVAPIDSPPNIISGNGQRGVQAEDSTLNIFGNLIGVDATGNAALPNELSGIRLESCDSAAIGWSGQFTLYPEEERNIISGNGARGVRLIECEDVEVYGNFIGLGADGDTALGNVLEGLLIERCVGIAALHNISSANGRDGIRVEGQAQSGEILIWYNILGADSTGELARGNGMDGLMTAADGGGIMALENVIAFNTGNGVNIAPGSGDRNILSANSIHSNGLLGINLGVLGVTGNDALDADSGPNGLINFPVITSIVGTTVSGTYHGLPNTEFVIQVFQNGGADPSGHGEGQFYLGQTLCTTDAAGNAAWSLAGVAYRTTPLFIAATATDEPLQIGTSEFGPVELTNLCKIDCPEEPVVLSAIAGCIAIPGYGVEIAGNCDPDVTLEFDPPEGSVLSLGDTPVTATLRDAGGNILDECAFTVRVVDDTAPFIVCSDPITRPSDTDLCGANVMFAGGALDFCDPDPVFACSIPDGMGGVTIITSPHFFPVGTTTVTCTATDNVGNMSECMFDVTVNDAQGPILDCDTKVEVEADQFGNVIITESLLFPGGVMDNCPDCAVESIVFDPPVIGCALLQEYMIAVTAVDCRGNTSTCTYTVTVIGPDCNNNLVSDGCDIRNGTSLDCNNNFIPDECECLWCNGEAPAEAEEATGQASHEGGGVPMGTRVVDDIYLCPGQLHRLTQFTGVMLTSSHPSLRRARLDLYEDCNGVPAAEPFLTVGPEGHEILDAVQGPDGLTLVTYRFDLCDLCLWLEGGKTYWVGLTGLTDRINQDISYWVADLRPEAVIVGKPPFKAEGTIIPPWNGEYEFGEWMPADECCLGCHNMVFCLFGDSCKILWDNGPAALGAGAGGTPSGAHQAYEARAADDLVTQTCDDHEVCVIDAWIWTDCNPVHGFIEVYENEPCNSPTPGASAWRTFDVEKAIETDETTTINGRPYRLVCLRLVDPDLTLYAGRTYWISAGARSTGSFVTNSFFAWGSRDCRECDYTIAPGKHRTLRPLLTEWEPTNPAKSFAFRIAVRPETDLIPTGTPAGGEGQPACIADANSDGLIGVNDIFHFLAAWFAGCP